MIRGQPLYLGGGCLGRPGVHQSTDGWCRPPHGRTVCLREFYSVDDVLRYFHELTRATGNGTPRGEAIGGRTNPGWITLANEHVSPLTHTTILNGVQLSSPTPSLVQNQCIEEVLLYTSFLNAAVRGTVAEEGDGVRGRRAGDVEQGVGSDQKEFGAIW